MWRQTSRMLPSIFILFSNFHPTCLRTALKLSLNHTTFQNCFSTPKQRGVPGTDTSLPHPATTRVSVPVSWLELEWTHQVLAHSTCTSEVRNPPCQVLHQGCSQHILGLTSCCGHCHHRREWISHCQAGWHLQAFASPCASSTRTISSANWETRSLQNKKPRGLLCNQAV